MSKKTVEEKADMWVKQAYPVEALDPQFRQRMRTTYAYQRVAMKIAIDDFKRELKNELRHTWLGRLIGRFL